MDKERLLKARLGEDELEIPGVGTIRIRALNRTEGHKVRGRDKPLEELERFMLSRAVVDPELTEDEVAAWQEAAPAGEIEKVTVAIAELSGFDTGALKEAYKSVRS